METNEEVPEIQKKNINGVELTNEDLAKIAMICDYLVVDRFHDVSSFLRLEKCFGPFFAKENPEFLPDVFKEICGEKKKYITYGRLINAYTKWKSKSSTNENFNKFMNLVFGDIIKTQNEVVGKLVEGGRIFSTRNTRGRKVISKFSVITDETKNQLKGFHIQYDDVFDSVLSPDKTKENITLEMNFEPNGREIRDRDGISHIGGKYSITKGIIKFLIFKCRFGKTFYIGDISEDKDEQFELFLFGTSSCQLKSLRVEIINNQLTYFEPKFQPSLRVNTKIKDFDSIDEKFIDENITNAPLVFEENEMQNLPMEQLVETNSLLIPCIPDDAFVDKKLLVEPLSGKDFNEIYKTFLVSQSEKLDEEKENLKKKIYEKTIMRKHLLKIYFKKFQVNENISVLKSPKQPESRVKMDKFLAKVKGYKKRMNKKIEEKKQEIQNKEKEDYSSFWNDDEEDWPEDKNLENIEDKISGPPKEEPQKEETPKEEPPKEESPKEESSKEGPPKEEPPKTEELNKEEKKIEINQPKEEKVKIEESKIENVPEKVENEVNKKENKVEVNIEPPKVDEIKVEDPGKEEKIIIEFSNEKKEEPQEEKIRLKAKVKKLPRKLNNENKVEPPKTEEIKQEPPKTEEIKLEPPKTEEIKPEPPKTEEIKQEPPKTEIKTEIPKKNEENKIIENKNENKIEINENNNNNTNNKKEENDKKDNKNSQKPPEQKKKKSLCLCF